MCAFLKNWGIRTFVSKLYLKRNQKIELFCDDDDKKFQTEIIIETNEQGQKKNKN